MEFELLKGYARKGGTPRCMFHLDLQKSYDTIDWSALQCILHEIGIPSKFVDWIMSIITSVTYNFNVNGELIGIMEAKRGIRQGDPISPLLFFIMMEYMNRAMNKMPKNPDYNYHSKCERLGITHLSFAYHVLLFSRGDYEAVELLL